MDRKLSKVEDNSYSISTKLPKIIEKKELYDLDDKDMDIIPEGSIKYELNLIEFPIFSKDKKVDSNVSKKYIFSEKNDEYLEIVPSAKQSHISNKILQEFDEQIFYGLMRIYEETGNREIISSYPTLLKVSGIKYVGDSLSRVKDSLERMSGCMITFSKCFFQKKDDIKIKDTKEIHLLSSLRIIRFEDDTNGQYKKHFEKHGNLKEIFAATLNEEIVKNLDNKLHKYFKIEDLVEIKNATARKLYIMLTKWRHWQKDSPMRRTTKFLASRIPLSWKKSNIPKTVISLENACEVLQKLGKIKYFKFNKEESLEASTIDFYFEENFDVLSFLNSKIGIDQTGHENLFIENILESKIPVSENKEEIEPPKAEPVKKNNLELLTKFKEEIKKLKSNKNIEGIMLESILLSIDEKEEILAELLERLNTLSYKPQNLRGMVFAIISQIKTEPIESWITTRTKIQREKEQEIREEIEKEKEVKIQKEKKETEDREKDEKIYEEYEKNYSQTEKDRIEKIADKYIEIYFEKTPAAFKKSKTTLKNTIVLIIKKENIDKMIAFGVNKDEVLKLNLIPDEEYQKILKIV